MIPAIACLLVPFLSGCPEYVEAVPSISALEQRPAQYSGAAVRVTGEVQRLEQLGFVLCRGGCVRVFMQARTPLRSGERVTVRGVYFREHTVGKKTYYNEIEATEIVPRE